MKSEKDAHIELKMLLFIEEEKKHNYKPVPCLYDD